jgi:hypothetical protein
MMTSTHPAVRWLQIVSALAMVYSIVMVFIISFDPAYVLEDMLIKDLYGKTEMAFEVIAMYDFLFLLYAWASVVVFTLLFGLITFGIGQKQKWAYYFVLGGLVLWIGGASAIAFLQHAYTYFFFLGVFFILFLPPLFVLRKH